MKNTTAAHRFREAADKIWQMAEEYREKDLELAKALKDLSSELHSIARIKEETARLT
jgi:cytochrome c556